jgi:hypothetical protein
MVIMNKNTRKIILNWFRRSQGEDVKLSVRASLMDNYPNT